MHSHPIVQATSQAKNLPPVRALFDLMVGTGNVELRV